ncbi:FAD binding domain-containing protein [Paracraurococcus ruber]|uniref:FAD-binding molybdopterin dehydrogenase n=1 Tax=Paracraurococcus ruber TaxID=77675 RepID=A0ABS1CVP6_9PROT|nr:xanthine dehydrogenase family protein subunit M [Paracraurococcus ruber]MBK1658311.1 FAD-binding molybdopterin dehydrogenase [Paracraurococcus ruber]TDG30919.1 xanthine dehydrogenase family protein subunit M [Paracraurococcus ruber]
MRPFAYERVPDPAAAQRAVPVGSSSAAAPVPTMVLAGGTTLLDLMKLDVLRPERLLDIRPLESRLGAIRLDGQGLRLGALARMAQVADDVEVRREFPVLAESLALAASAQLRNMATLGGNVLQRTRCSYYRDVSYAACNKRNPGSGCAALDGYNRLHAVLGTSEHCIASYPGDFAQALMALDAVVEIEGPQGGRSMPFAELHRAPGDRPDIETTLRPGELITAFQVPAGPWAKRSRYVKVRDRQSYAFAAASAAVALDLDGDRVRGVRIALGGVATRPWRATDAEAALAGQRLDEASAMRAAEVAFRDARTHGENDDKPELGRRTLVRALLEAQRMEIA